MSALGQLQKAHSESNWSALARRADIAAGLVAANASAVRRHADFQFSVMDFPPGMVVSCLDLTR